MAEVAVHQVVETEIPANSQSVEAEVITDGLVDAKVWEDDNDSIMEPQLVEVILGTVNVFLVIVDLVAQGWRLLMVVSVGYFS